MGTSTEKITNIDEIGVAQEENVQEIAGLNRQFHLDIEDFEWDKPEWIKEEIGKGNYYILKQCGLVLGAIDLQKIDADEIYIEAIAVDSASHGLGIGKKLIDYAKQRAREMGCKKISVESFESYDLLGFYQRVGFGLDNPPTGYYEGKPFHRFVMNL